MVTYSGSDLSSGSEREGLHNLDLAASQDRLLKAGSTRNLSTICIVPSLGLVPTKVVSTWLALQPGKNQFFSYMFNIGKEVGVSYSEMVEHILSHEGLSKARFILTLEEDNMPPPDGLAKL